jgi:uncharacterized protein
MKKEKFLILGMTCHHCEMKIENSLKELKGVKKVKASFKDKTVEITYDDNFNKEEAKKVVDDLGYNFKGNVKNNKTKLKDVLPILLFFLGFYFGIKLIFNINIFNFVPVLDKSVSFGMLFLVGLLTSVHCIGMCGSINLAVVMKEGSDIKSPILYNFGRIISYTIIGGIVGFLGSLFTFDQRLQVIVILIASIIMLFMGLSMIGWLPIKLYFLIPKMPKIFKKNNKKTPFIVGLLNGLMPCGPLQAMQIYALGTGSIYYGALSMFFFALGTVPLMLGFGVLFIKLRGKHALIIQRISAVLIILLSIFMFNRAVNLSGVDVFKDLRASLYSDYAIAEIKEDHQYVEIQLDYLGYKPIIVQKDIPVIFNIKVSDIRYFGCTNAFVINDLDMTVELKTGDNLIKFTPTKVGNMKYTCWMGMVTSNIKVVDNILEYGG